MLLTSSTSQIFKNSCVVEISVHPVRGVFVVFVDIGIGGKPSGVCSVPEYDDCFTWDYSFISS